MPICRIRQIVKEIEGRMVRTHLREDLITEWQTKTLAAFIAATVRTEKGQTNPLMKAVDDIKLVDQEKRMSDQQSVKQAGPEPTLEEIIENGSPTAAAQNKVGSFEALGGSRAVQPPTE